jgi:chromosome segregation ATPase
MRLCRLELEHFRKFDRPVVVEGLSPGLNLIAGPNEMGKSTLLMALRAVLFERHASKAQAIRDLEPNRLEGAAPRVRLDFMLGEDRYLLEKRFLRRPFARLEAPDGRAFEGEAAERELQRLLGIDPGEPSRMDGASPGHFGVLLAQQTQSFRQPELTLGTRHALQDMITREIDQLGGNSEIEALIDEVKAARFDLVDRRGKPKERYKAVLADLDALGGEIDGLERQRADLQADLEALAEAETAAKALDREEAETSPQATLERLETRQRDLLKRQEAEARIAAAKRELEALEARRDAGEKLQQDRVRLGAELAEAQAAGTSAVALLAEIEADGRLLQERQGAALDAAAALDRRIRALEQLGERLAERGRIMAALEAVATAVRLDLEPAALDRVRLDGETPEAARQTVQVTNRLAIEIEGVGRIEVEPRVDQLRELARERDRLDGLVDDLAAELELGALDEEAIQLAWTEARDAAGETKAVRRETEAEIGAWQARRRQLEDASQVSRTQQAELEKALARIDAELEAVSQAAELEPAIRAAGETLKAVLEAAAPLPAVTGDREQLDAAIRAARQKLQDLDGRRHASGLRIEGLRQRIAALAGQGLDERLDDARRKEALLAGESQRFAAYDAALALLAETLEASAARARAQYVGPLTARLEPYVRTLLPGARLGIDDDFRITALGRATPGEERFAALSDGTREQIAVIARLAFAEMLRDQGLPAFLVLDDALVFADAERLARMFALLQAAAKDLQIILLTCREDRFEALAARQLVIAPLEAEAAASPSARLASG